MMDKNFLNAAERLFYPKAEKKKSSKEHFYFYRGLLIVPILLLVSYGLLLFLLADKIYNLAEFSVGPLNLKVFLLICSILFCCSLFLSFRTFEKNAHSKSRALRATVTVICCLLAGFVIFTILMSGNVIFTTGWMLIFLAVPFLSSVFVFFYIVYVYKKDAKKYLCKHIKRIPKWLLVWLIILTIQYADDYFSGLPSEAFESISTAYNTICCILTEDRDAVEVVVGVLNSDNPGKAEVLNYTFDLLQDR